MRRSLRQLQIHCKRKICGRRFDGLRDRLGVTVSDLWELAETGADNTDPSLLAVSAKLEPTVKKQLLDYASYLLNRQSD